MERGAEIRSRGSLLYRRGELAVLLSLSGAALLLLFLTNSTQATIARHVEDFVLSPFRALDRGLRQVRAVLVGNHELTAELAAARLELAHTEEMRRENERLRAMLGFEAREGFRLIGGEVLAEGAGRLGGSTVLINCGYDQGLREGMALIGRQGLVGKVVEIRPKRSHALLLTHPDCAVAARLDRSRVAGIVEWQPGSFTSLKLRHISYLADVRVGDQVISSGLGGVFPEGIPVGTVTKIDNDVTGLVLDITLKPATDFRALEEIFALQSTGAARSPDSIAVFGAPPAAAFPPGAFAVPLTDKPSMDKQPTDKLTIDNPSIDKPPTDKPSIDKPPIDKPPTDKPPTQ